VLASSRPSDRDSEQISYQLTFVALQILSTRTAVNSAKTGMLKCGIYGTRFLPSRCKCQ
jgi:hypothetical protein